MSKQYARELKDISIKKLAEMIKKDVKGLHVVGSIARKSHNINDIDFVTLKDLNNIIVSIKKEYEPLGFKITVLKNGKKHSSILFNNIDQIDFWKADNKDDLKYMKINRKIDKGHNIAYRKKARELGFKLNDYGLYNDGERLHYKNEKELRTLLHIE
jgi:DNA polymerase (family 10)